MKEANETKPEKKYSEEEKKKEMILFLSSSEEKEGLLSKANRKLLSDPLNDNNPITVQVLGICSALAITVQLKPAIVMSLAVMFVMALSNVIISILRNSIPSNSNYRSVGNCCLYGNFGGSNLESLFI